jgi:ketosteroid isomerase-like protein
LSEENVELHRRAVWAYNAGDIEGFIGYFDPSIEFHSAVTTPGGAVYQGHDGIRRWHRDLEDAFGGQLRIEPEQYFDLGEHTLMSYVDGRGRQSGVEVAMPQAQVATWRDGVTVYSKAYLRIEDALEDLGVSEDTLEPIDP